MGESANVRHCSPIIIMMVVWMLLLLMVMNDKGWPFRHQIMNEMLKILFFSHYTTTQQVKASVNLFLSFPFVFLNSIYSDNIRCAPLLPHYNWLWSKQTNGERGERERHLLTNTITEIHQRKSVIGGLQKTIVYNVHHHHQETPIANELHTTRCTLLLSRFERFSFVSLVEDDLD